MKMFHRRTNDKPAARAPRRWMMGVVTYTMLTITAFSALTPAPVEAAGEPRLARRQGRLVMYAMDGSNLNLSDAHADKLDQLNYSFALIRDGEASGDHWRHIDKVRAFLRRNPQVDGVVSVGGWGADGFSDACATEEGRTRLAESILRLMDDNGFVGVDIDWEYPGSSAAGIVSRPEDEENWYALLEKLRVGLDQRAAKAGRPYILSVAIGCGEEQLDRVDGARLDMLVDQAVLMTYDLSGFEKTTGHHAGLYPGEDRPNSGAHAVRKLARSGLSHSRMLLGFPAYAHVWRQVSGGGDGLHQQAATSGNKTIAYPAIQALTREGYAEHYDEQACAAWWFDGETFVSGENERSVQEKGAWLRQQGLQGAAVWSWNNDPDSAFLTMLDSALAK